jgi:hypothetical protein
MPLSDMLGIRKGGNEVQGLGCLAEHISYYQLMKNQTSFTKTVRIADVRTEKGSKELSNMKRFKT